MVSSTARLLCESPCEPTSQRCGNRVDLVGTSAVLTAPPGRPPPR
ncbi:hypothetical protein HMPREF0975_02968, partial [Actinomyces sp. oral taxon 849 str. F0330]